MENKNRNEFALNGISGLVIAVVLLLSIAALLTTLGINAQKEALKKPYVLENPASVQKINKQNAKHMLIKER